MQDDSLEDCRNQGRPRYRQVGGTGFIFATSGGWYGSTISCDATTSVTQFFSYSTVATPYKVTASSWWIVTIDRTSWNIYPSLTVAAVAADNCGKSV